MSRKRPKPSADMSTWSHLGNLLLTLLGRGTYPTWCFGCGMEERAFTKGPALDGWGTVYLTEDGGPPVDRDNTNRIILCPSCVAGVSDSYQPHVVQEYIAIYGRPQTLRPDVTLTEFASSGL